MTEMPSEKPIVALSADLIFAARIRGANDRVILAKNVDDLLAQVQSLQPRLVVLDMDRRGLDVSAVIARVKASSDARILAYVSHVREELIAEAQAAGADRGMARGAFARQMMELLQ